MYEGIGRAGVNFLKGFHNNVTSFLSMLHENKYQTFRNTTGDSLHLLLSLELHPDVCMFPLPCCISFPKVSSPN